MRGAETVIGRCRRAAVAVVRFARAAVHIGLGAWICAVRFPRMDAAARSRTVGWWSARLLAVIDVQVDAHGSAVAGPVLCVANHVSWLDILALNAVAPSRFVAKADIRRWPLLGWLTACGGTLFIARERRRDALRVGHAIAAALRDGDRVALFPEGTTTDGRALLPFHANLLQSAVATGAPVQPIALRYADSEGDFSRRAAFVGDMGLWQSVWAVLGAQELRVRLDFLAPIGAQGHDRQALAVLARTSIDASVHGATSASDTVLLDEGCTTPSDTAALNAEGRTTPHRARSS